MSNGTWTQIPNDLLEALCRTRIPGEARQVFDCIMRKTVGWGKIADVISITQIQDMTGLRKDTICKARKRLVDMHMLRIAQLGNGLSTKYEIITAYATWKPLPKKETLAKTPISIAQKGNGIAQLATTKDIIQKKVKNKEYDQTLFDRFWTAYPRKVAKPNALKAWIKINPDETLTTQIIESLNRQRRLWDDPKYIPHPATWLNQRRWEDQVLDLKPIRQPAYTDSDFGTI